MTPFLEIKNVCKRFGPLDVVRDISLQIEKGEFIALLGPSGCGKTTTLNMLGGFVPPTSGEIRIEGREMSGVPAHKRNVGFVFQNYALFPHMDVRDNVGFGLRMRKVNQAEVASRVSRAIDLVRLSGLESRGVRELSGGQQQRVALARALVIEPSVLLLDEPLSNLDAALREQMRFEIRDIQQRIGITTVFVTHDQAEALATADRLVVMNKGRVHQVGMPREIYEQPADSFVAKFIGGANLLAGTVTAMQNGYAVITAGGQQLHGRCANTISPGQSVELLLRPEAATVAVAPVAGQNNLPGRIVRITYLGSSVTISVAVAGTAIAVEWRGEGVLPEINSEIHVTWPPSRCIIIPAGEDL